MNSLWLKTSSAALYLATCLLIGTGLLLEFRFEDQESLRILGLGLDDAEELHFVTALVFIGLTGLHLVLNWAWIKAAARGMGYASVVLFSGIALMLVLLLAPGSHGTGADGKPGGGDCSERDDD
jgi:cell division protein FtsW (lipid II flippase)